MSMMDLLERLQDTWLSQTISQSTWGYPIIGAIHVLAIALFGGAVIITNVDDVRWLKSVGLTAVIATGALLFISAPVRYYDSTFFRIKMVLLALILVNSTLLFRQRSALRLGIALVLWAAVIFAARGIAFL